MTFDERVQALGFLHFTPRQTAFLVTVALHGGYCLRRQYGTFASLAYGQAVRDFFDALVTRDLAQSLRFEPNRGHVYHLHAKTLYRALEQPDNRNRRVVSPLQIARKLMVLDYVLATPTVEWLATEHDKVAFFTTTHGVALVDLPQRRYQSSDGRRVGTTRYFIHKQPIALEAETARVTFVYLSHDETGAGFDQFLQDHLRLLSRLSAWTMAVVCPPHVHGLDACRRVFARTFAASNGLAGSPDRDDLRWFFRARQAVDRGDLRGLSVADLTRFRDARRRWTTAPIERLYATWRREGDGALAAGDVGVVAPAAERERLTTYQLPFRYQQFGAMPGVA